MGNVITIVEMQEGGRLSPLQAKWYMPLQLNYLGFYSIKLLEVFFPPLPGQDASPLLQDNTPSIKFAVTHYVPGWKVALSDKSVLPKNTMQLPHPELKPRPINSESALH